MLSSRKNLDQQLSQWREQLAGDGPTYWRSLEELSESDAFQALIQQEFPEQADVWPDAFSRRSFLTVMAASLALGGVGCSVRPAPAEKIVPNVRPAAGTTPGRPLFFATTVALGGDAIGLLVESHMGRPTKIEGNPDHPASLGATDAAHQASVLSLYDPDRSQTVTFEGQIRGWNDAERVLRTALQKQQEKQGRGLRLLTETAVSPTLSQQLRELLREFPAAKWHQYQPVNQDNAHRGGELAFGEGARAVYDFTRAHVIVSLDADFLVSEPGHVRYARDFISRRRLPLTAAETATASMSRLYVVEPSVTCTGAKADHRLAVPGRQIEAVAAALLRLIEGDAAAGANQRNHAWTAAAAQDLATNRGRSLVVAGYRQPPAVHALAHVLNERLGNVGQTVRYIEPVIVHPVDCTTSLKELVDDMTQGDVELLVILGGNPAYTAPADLSFSTALEQVPLRVHLGLYVDETARLCQWHLPEAHFLESWSDARAFDGTASLVQPLIAPLYQGRTAHELLAFLISGSSVAGDEIVRSYWRRQRVDEGGDGDFETWWQTALHDGVIADSAFASKTVRVRDDWQDRLARSGVPPAGESSAGLEIAFEVDPYIYDGSLANNAWLQELPRPLTKLTWDNAVVMSPATAESLGVKLGAYAHGGERGGYRAPVVELRLNERAVRGPVWIMPGHADGCVSVQLGYGRREAGQVGGNKGQTVGFNAYPLRSSAEPWFARGLQIKATGEHYSLACTQAHYALEGRDLVRSGTLEEFQHSPSQWKHTSQGEESAEQKRTLPATIYPTTEQHHPAKRQWGMLIDMTACIGCSACIVACQSENNIPVVGKEQVLFGREMHWLRIDRYIAGPADAPEQYHFQPLPCMHCEHAPCEYVCPVAATVHSADGLNDMVYNRCVGTRFCSNNCPYKVRRFNFLAYSDYHTPARRLQYNPDVTVRTRGVMEKCTYCVQRIRSAEIDAEAAGRAMHDGEVLTACQAVCPTEAILFGDLNDPQSKVARAKRSPLEYGLLTELNTFPRTTYLAEIRNPNLSLPVA
jgi:molybdopterin-containing oxidoreductase family iron-sulfur binding subunit